MATPNPLDSAPQLEDMLSEDSGSTSGGVLDDDISAELEELDREPSDSDDGLASAATPAATPEPILPPADAGTEPTRTGEGGEGDEASPSASATEADVTPTDTPTATDQDESILSLSREELLQLLADRGEERAPAAQPTEPEPTADAAQQEAWQKSYEAYVGHYALSDDQAEAVISEPERVLPELAARITMNTIQAVMSLLPSAVPSLLQEHERQAASVNLLEAAVTQAVGGDYPPQTLAAAQAAVGTLHPDLAQGDPAKYAESVAAMVAMMMGKQAGAQPSATPAAPSATPARRVPAAAMGSGPVAPPTGSQTMNEFEALAEDDLAQGDR